MCWKTTSARPEDGYSTSAQRKGSSTFSSRVRRKQLVSAPPPHISPPSAAVQASMSV